MRLAALDLFAKTDERVRECTALGGVVTAACVLVLALSVADEYALMRAVVRSTSFSAYTSRERRLRMHVHLELWFPALGCDDVVVDVTDSSGSQAGHLSGASLIKQRTDAAGVPLGHPAQRIGPSELPSAGMRLRDELDALAAALRGLAALRACSTPCTPDWAHFCPRHWSVVPTGGCAAPPWYAGPCARFVRFASEERALVSEMMEGCKVDWPCGPARTTGGAERAHAAAAGWGSGDDEEDKARARAAELLRQLRLATRALHALAADSLNSARAAATGEPAANATPPTPPEIPVNSSRLEPGAVGPANGAGEGSGALAAGLLEGGALLPEPDAFDGGAAPGAERAARRLLGADGAGAASSGGGGARSTLSALLPRLLRSPELALSAEQAGGLHALAAALGAGEAFDGASDEAAPPIGADASAGQPRPRTFGSLLLIAQRDLEHTYAQRIDAHASALRCVLASAERVRAHLRAAAHEREAVSSTAEAAEEARAGEGELGLGSAVDARLTLEQLSREAERALNASSALAAPKATAAGGAEEAEAEAAKEAERAAHGGIPSARLLSELEASLVRSLQAAEQRLGAQAGEGCALSGTIALPFAPGRVSVTPGYRRGLVRASRAHHAAVRAPAHAQPRRSPLAARAWNASHAVRRLAFGRPFPGQRAPLEPAAFSAAAPSDVRYTLTVVPTVYEGARGAAAVASYEYAATRHVHVLGPDSADGRLPGVHFAVEVSPLRLRVAESLRYGGRQFAWRALSIGSNLFVVGQIVVRVLHLAARLRTSRRQAAAGPRGGAYELLARG